MHQGLLPAIRSLCRRNSEIYKDIELDVKLEISEEDIPERLKIICYRVIQECFNNAVKHSCADNLQICLGKENSRIHLSVSDNGKGFDVETTVGMSGGDSGMGLPGMIERVELAGGSIEITSKEMHSTRIKIELPLKDVD